MSRYTLYYWPFLPGRGEYVRLMFEAAQVEYRDIARDPEDAGGGVAAIHRVIGGDGLRPFAVPAVEVDGQVIGQVANILHTLAPTLGLAPRDEALRSAALQLQMTVADWIAEVHDTHHPVSTALYYEQQIDEARAAAKHFRQSRLHKFGRYFEAALGDAEWFVGGALSYVDLSVAHTLDGIEYAFPIAFAEWAPTVPKLVGLRARIHALPAIAAYLKSPRRMAFNEHGVFRRYPALDGPISES